MDNTQKGSKKIGRSGLLIVVQEFNGTEWHSVGICRTIDRINGKIAKTMTDEELLSSWTPTSKNWGH